MQTIHGAEMQIPDIIVRLLQNGTGGMHHEYKTLPAPMVCNDSPQEFCLHSTSPPADEGRQRKGDMNGQNGEKGCHNNKCESSYLLSCSGWSPALPALSTLTLKQRLKSLIFSLRVCGPSTSTC